MNDEWISVDDMLPQAFESVAVYIPTQKPFPTVHEGYLVDDINNHPDFWYIPALHQKYDLNGFIVAWTAMPDPPEENTEWMTTN